MIIFRKCVSIFLVVLFLAYSGGIGFSIHNCEHCHEIRIYVFNHPDCCPASAAEHHHGELATNVQLEKCCSHEDCHPSKEVSPEAITAHCHQCCISEHQFYKINSKYIASQYNKIIPSIENFPAVLVDFMQQQRQIFALTETTSPDPPKHIPPLIPGGEQFLIFSHQLLFYA